MGSARFLVIIKVLFVCGGGGGGGFKEEGHVMNGGRAV